MDLQKIATYGSAAAVVGTGAVVGGATVGGVGGSFLLTTAIRMST